MIKTCSKCKIEKDINEFSKNKKSKDGLTSYCKFCAKESYNKWILNNKTHKKEYNKQWEKDNESYRQEYRHDWNRDNHEKRKELKTKWDLENKDYIRTYNQKWEIDNKEYRKKYKVEYNHQNRKNINNHLKYRRNTDVNFKIQIYYRNRITSALKNNQKYGKTLEILGCTINELKQYLEKQFKNGMNWDNYGKGYDKWNIDHIIPCSFFDMSDSTEQKICFHYTNLQPLWEPDNLLKSDKILNN